MKSIKNNKISTARNEKGVVLFFALIALVAMSLAAVALIRAVDTNSAISGNLSFKQSTLLSADRGVETAIIWAKDNATALNSDASANGYYATFTKLPSETKLRIDTNGFLDGTDAEGNRISYIVERMCSATGAPTEANCLYGPVPDTSPCDMSGGNDDLKKEVCQQPAGPAFRVTSKVVGPKNTVSYIQAFVY
ncbi:MAG: pilus assembly PilX family protein [Methylophilaceae bacterium]